MADWKQITARIRRARTSKDPAAQLANLFEKTNDAMVAFELAKFFETTGQNPDAAKWYSTAADRFRRADWKIKAQEAAVRLGGAAPSERVAATESGEAILTSAPIVIPEPGLPIEQNAAVLQSLMAVSSEIQAATEESQEAPLAGEAPQTPAARRRRGRRGGRNRRRGASESASSPSTPATPAQLRTPARTQGDEPPSRFDPPPRREISVPPIDSIPERAEPGVKGRFGDPGLASRLSLMEMQLRRLLTCPASKLDLADKAPAGPGVFVLTDDDLTTYYYVEACDTLRVAIAQLLRGSGGRRGNPTLKPQLADHLGIPETRVAKYLSDHCVVRWLQLDEGATYFAHYTIAVLRPILNE